MKIGKIYKIICKLSDDIYIGSTFNTLRDRWRNHKSDYKRKKKGISIFKYFEKYHIENFKIILIKKYEVYDRKHLQAYEQLYINKTKCVNIQSPLNLLTKLKDKNYRENHKEYYKEYFKNYHLNNADKKIKISQKYYNNNKNKVKEYKEEYYKTNIEKIKEYRKQKIKCNICNCEIAIGTNERHNKSIKHKKVLEAKHNNL